MHMIHLCFRIAITCSIILIARHVCAAESSTAFENALATDRPDNTESSQTVGKHRLQIETSVAITYDRANNITTRTYNFPTLVRYGVINPLEFRIEGELFNIQTTTGSASEHGFSDVAFGIKVHLHDNVGWIPSCGVLARLSVPTGTTTFSSKAVEPIIKILAEWALPAGFTFGTNLGANFLTKDATGDRFAQLLYTATVGHDIPGTHQRLRVFVENAGIVSVKPGKPNLYQFDAGMAFIITPNTQIDAAAQIGLNQAAPDIAGGVGFSVRM